LTKNFVIKAEAFSKEAIKMIELMGGTVVELID
jgi:ribosomal protein L15